MKALWEAVRQVEDQVVAWRRDIHAHPEPAFEEVRTAGLAAEVCKQLGFEVRTGIAKTGLVADLDVGADRRIGFRADMDALKMTEENDLPYRSLNEGVAHMCGHDAHTAMLLGTATVLAGMKEQLGCNVRFIFQPSEEAPPGGAVDMVRAGAHEGLDEVYAIHVDSSHPTGVFCVNEGATLASADEFEICIRGKGGHGASPHVTHDPIVAASEVILALQTIVSRRRDPIDPVVVSVCQVNAGTAFNVIPMHATLKGTFRTLCDATRQMMPGTIEEVARTAASVHRCEVDMKLFRGYPMTINHPRQVQRVRDVIGKLFDNPEQFGERPARMGGEDFSFFLEKVPGAFIWLGTKNPEKGIIHEGHHPRFNIDEAAMVNGVALFCGLALKG